MATGGCRAAYVFDCVSEVGRCALYVPQVLSPLELASGRDLSPTHQCPSHGNPLQDTYDIGREELDLDGGGAIGAKDIRQSGEQLPIGCAT